MADVTPEPIVRIALGFMAAKHLFTASAIGLFENLAGGLATFDELVEKCGIPPRTLRISVDAMVSFGLLEREEDRYRNSPAAAAFLSGTADSDLRPALRLWDRISYPLFIDLERAVRAGEGQRQFDRFSEEQQQIFSTGVESFTAGAATALAANYDFGGHRSVLDVGGGTGSFLVTILRRYPALKGTLFELPGACAVARQRLDGEPEGARISVVEGDLFKDRLPSGHDALILANTVHVLSSAHNIELLRNMRTGAERHARLLMVDIWMDASHSQPPPAPLRSAEFLLFSGEGQVYAESEADEWLVQTGWRKLERKPLVGLSSVIIAEAV